MAILLFWPRRIYASGVAEQYSRGTSEQARGGLAWLDRMGGKKKVSVLPFARGGLKGKFKEEVRERF